MEIRATPGPIDGLFLIDIEVRDDPERPGGSFREIFHAERFADLGLPPFAPVQWNISESTEGTLRGFHAEPWNKLVHVAAGTVFAAIADLRAASPTAGVTWTGELDRTRGLFVGAGLGNAFQATWRSTPTWSMRTGRPTRPTRPSRGTTPISPSLGRSPTIGFCCRPRTGRTRRCGNTGRRTKPRGTAGATHRARVSSSAS